MTGRPGPRRSASRSRPWRTRRRRPGRSPAGRPGEPGRDRRGHAEPHRGQAVGDQHRARLGRLPHLARHDLVRADVDSRDGAGRGGFPGDRNHVGGVEPALDPPGQPGRVQPGPVRRYVGFGPAGLARPLRGQPAEDRPDVASQLAFAGVNLVGVRGGVQVQHRGGDRPRADQLHRVDAGGQDQVGPGQQVPDHAVAGHVEHPGEVRVVLGEDALGHRRDDDGDPGKFGQPDQLRVRGRPSSAARRCRPGSPGGARPSASGPDRRPGGRQSARRPKPPPGPATVPGRLHEVDDRLAGIAEYVPHAGHVHVPGEQLGGGGFRGGFGQLGHRPIVLGAGGGAATEVRSVRRSRGRRACLRRVWHPR